MNESFVIYAGQPRLIKENLKSILYTLKKFKAKAFFAFWQKDDPNKTLKIFLKEKIPNSQIYYIKERSNLTDWIEDKNSSINQKIYNSIIQYDALDQAYDLLKKYNKLTANSLVVRSRTDLYIKPSRGALIFKKNCILVPGAIFGVGLSDFFSYGFNKHMASYFNCINSKIFLYKSGYLLPSELVLALHLGKNKVPFFINKKLKMKLLQDCGNKSLRPRTTYHAQVSMRPTTHFAQWHDQDDLEKLNESFLDEIYNRSNGIFYDLMDKIFKKSYP